MQKARLNAGRGVDPSYGLIVSQSVKTTLASKDRGVDGGKKSRVTNDTS
ncbi:MAG: hypothetical protein LBE70_00095 [Nitrososphaerota archaeon]|nr:hypothetical protein [Nitrososphaerota archaeon]